MKTVSLRYPISWDEVGLRDLQVIADTLPQMLSRREMLTVLFLRLTGCSRMEGYDCRLTKGGVTFDLPLEALVTACEELSFILDTVGLPGVCPLGLNRKMYNVRFGDWFAADALISKYESTGDLDSLIKAVVTLDCRYELSERGIRMLLIYWHGLSAYLRDRYPKVFREGDGDGSVSPADTLTGLLDLVTEHHPGENERILKADVHAVLAAINNRLEDYAYNIRH